MSSSIWDDTRNKRFSPHPLNLDVPIIHHVQIIPSKNRLPLRVRGVGKECCQSKISSRKESLSQCVDVLSFRNILLPPQD